MEEIPARMSTSGPYPLSQFEPGDFYYYEHPMDAPNAAKGFVFLSDNGKDIIGFDFEGPNGMTPREIGDASPRCYRTHRKGEVIIKPGSRIIESKQELETGSLIVCKSGDKFMVIKRQDQRAVFVNLQNWTLCLELSENDYKVIGDWSFETRTSEIKRFSV